MSINVEKIGEALSEVTGGFSHTEIYVGFVEDFETMVEPKDREGASAATTLAELVTISDAHTFVTGKGFTKLRAIAETVGLETTQIGSPSMPVQENKLTVEILGSTADLLGYKRHLKGRDLVVLATEFDSGQLRQIGSLKYAGRVIESNSKIEPAIEGENKTTLVFGDKQKYDAPIYTGAITLQTP